MFSNLLSYETKNLINTARFSSVQFSCLVMSDSLRPHGLQHSRPPWSITTSQSLLKLMSFELVMPSNHLILCRPLLLSPSIFPSIRFFSNESVLCIRWPNYWSFSISPSNEYSGLISFRMGWLDLLAVQGTLKNLLQHHWECISQLPLNILYGCDLGTPRDAFLEMQRSWCHDFCGLEKCKAKL